MKITICGSIVFKSEMIELQKKLEVLGHEVLQPPEKVADGAGNQITVEQYYQLRKTETNNEKSWVWQRKAEAIRIHFNKINWADAILVANYDKKGVAGYIGSNTLIEMGVAFYLHKPIYLLKPIPEIDAKEEILGMQPKAINDDLGLIK